MELDTGTLVVATPPGVIGRVEGVRNVPVDERLFGRRTMFTLDRSGGSSEEVEALVLAVEAPPVEPAFQVIHVLPGDATIRRALDPDDATRVRALLNAPPGQRPMTRNRLMRELMDASEGDDPAALAELLRDASTGASLRHGPPRMVEPILAAAELLALELDHVLGTGDEVHREMAQLLGF